MNAAMPAITKLASEKISPIAQRKPLFRPMPERSETVKRASRPAKVHERPHRATTCFQ
jgi:hypothetical protein